MAREPIYMPKFGMTMTEGVIMQWLKKEGDQVVQGEPLLTVETEKVDTDIEATVSGTLVAIEYEAGDAAPVGEIIGYIETA